MAFRVLYSLLLAGLLIAAVVIRVIDPTPVARLRLLVFDTYQRLAPRTYDPGLPVKIVDIDEPSLDRIGQWPWARTKLADLTKRLQEMGAAAIGFDMVFAEADRLSPEKAVQTWPQSDATAIIAQAAAELPSNDATFAQAISGAPVVLGFIANSDTAGGKPALKAGFAHAGDDPKRFIPSFPGSAKSLDSLETAAKGSAALNWLPQYDQIIRRLPMLVNVEGQMYPSLAAETLRVAQEASTFVVKSSGASGEQAFGEHSGVIEMRIGSFVVPTDGEGEMWLRTTPPEPGRYIPAWKVLSGKVQASEITGKVILVGTSAAGLLDLRSTPLAASVPGVELHAQALEQIMAGSYLLRPDFATPAEIAFLVALGLLIGVLIYRSGALGSAIVGGLAVAGVIAASWQAFIRYGWLVDPVYPALALTAIYITGSLFVFLRTEGERNRVRSAFGHYMAPALVEKLAADPSKLKLGGELREMTLLFSDVRGFTGISEGLNAEELTRFINRLFTPLSNIILDEKGTIDKYMGDAVMAFWNAPLDDPDHAVNAARAALGMAMRIDGLNEEWRAEAQAQGRVYKPVYLGIGLNTGACCVGNLGSEKRFDYSVIGDNVNVASRLEGQTKTYGLPIVAGETTVAGAKHFAFLEIDLLKVKGRAGALRVFTLLGDDGVRRSEEFRTLQDAMTEFLTRYRLRQWDHALGALERVAAIDGGLLATVRDLYKTRIDRHRTDPPPDGWDGSATATVK